MFDGAQLHQVIPQRIGGPIKWWNAHPALPSQHPGGIHGTGSPNQGVFPTPVPRQMCNDYRLGGDFRKVKILGSIPPIALSRERRLEVRTSSPHESYETPNVFHQKITKAAIKARKKGFWRLNYASAIQPNQFRNMGDIVSVCEGLVRKFAPERIRVVQLSPDKEGNVQKWLSPQVINQLRQLEDVEVITIDARMSIIPKKRANKESEPGNIRVLADFFDFSLAMICPY